MKHQKVSSNVEELQLRSLEEGGDPAKTGRFLITYKEGAQEAGLKSLRSEHGLKIASARDFSDQAVDFGAAGDADVMIFPEIGVALIGSEAAQSRGLVAGASVASDSAVSSIDPEYFMFATQISTADYLKGVMHTAQSIYSDLAVEEPGSEEGVSPEVLGVTWGLNACKVPSSHYDGNGIKVAVLDTGFDLLHPDFVGRSFTTHTFVGQPVQDLHGHGTHTTGTACGPLSPAGFVARYGIGYRTQIFVGKVLQNNGSGTQAQVLAGMNWAVGSHCQVISMSLGGGNGVQPSYTAAGQAALNAGCLIIAAAGNGSHRPGSIAPAIAPANSPTIVSVAALDGNLKVAPFSSGGKVDIAAPGVNVYSSWPRPTLHNTISGTSMATPHVAGCAALWAQVNANFRGVALRARMLASAKHLPFPASDVGAGLVQAP